MAATYAKRFPLKGHPLRISWVIYDMATGKPYTGGLTTLAATISKDGGNFASTGSAPVEIQSSGTGYLELTATEMTADTVIVKVSCADEMASVFVWIEHPVDLTENAAHWRDAGTGLVKLEQGLLAVIQEATNQQDFIYATGEQKIYDKDGAELHTVSYTQGTNSSNQEYERRGRMASDA